VGKARPTRARYRLKTPADVAKVLGRIEGVLDDTENCRAGGATRAGARRR
jgi:hypothetical protein